MNSLGTVKQTRGNFPLFEITPFSLQDFPGHLACILWFAGCNMRCTYCHNPEIVFEKGKLSFEQAKDFLESRRNKLEAVVFSGGEASTQAQLIPLLKLAKSMGYKTKLDSNAHSFFHIKSLIDTQLIDFLAIDFKAPPSKWQQITGVKYKDDHLKSIGYAIQNKNIFLEIRTTVHRDLINEAEVNEMIQTLEKLQYKGTYYIQNYKQPIKSDCLGKLQVPSTPFNREKIQTKQCSFKIDWRNF